MQQRDEIRPLPHLPDLYEITAPFADLTPFQEGEALLEAHPYAVISHLSALVFHHLTDQLPKLITATIPADGTGGLLPLGTIGEDWQGLNLVRGRRPSHILGTPVRWVVTRAERFTGFREYRPYGYPMRVSTPERTLLDGLLEPELCGGLDNVLRAWGAARDTIDLDALVTLADQLGIAVLRQRAGYVLDRLGLSHPAVENWRHRVSRGGSSKLLGPAPYAPTYDERWALSLNASTTALHEDGL